LCCFSLFQSLLSFSHLTISAPSISFLFIKDNLDTPYHYEKDQNKRVSSSQKGIESLSYQFAAKMLHMPNYTQPRAFRKLKTLNKKVSIDPLHPLTALISGNPGSGLW